MALIALALTVGGITDEENSFFWFIGAAFVCGIQFALGVTSL